MSFFDKVKEPFRDKRRDDLCASLQSIGIDAKLAERWRAEENIECGVYSESLGMIDIREGSIRWVNVVSRSGQAPAGASLYVKYGVPDSRFWYVSKPTLEIESTCKKGNWQWKGTDSGLGIIDRLNGDSSIEYALLQSNSPAIRIRAYPDHICWVISTEWALSEELWNCYQMIARHLLAEWPTGHKLKIEQRHSAEPPTGDEVYKLCPRCGSSNMNKGIRRLPKSQQEIEALGFKCDWNCLCFNCRFEWVEREK